MADRLMTNVEARALLKRALLDDAEFEQLCLDNFAALFQRMSSGMDRLARENLLFQHVRPVEIEEALRKSFPERLAAAQDAAAVSAEQRPSRNAITPPVGGPAFGHGEHYRYVNRTKQYEYVESMLGRSRHEVVLIPGSQDEAHEWFLARVIVLLPTPPPNYIVSVRWPRRSDRLLPCFPTTRTEILTALSVSLGGKLPADLPGLLAHHLHNHHLVILHPIADRGFSDETLCRYYTEWLPELVEPYRSDFCCKLLQPIEWDPRSWLRRLFGPRGRAHRRQALDFILQVKRKQSSHLYIDATPELSRITLGDVIDFLKRIGYPEDGNPREHDIRRTELAREIMSGASSSREILNRIASWLREGK